MNLFQVAALIAAAVAVVMVLVGFEPDAALLISIGSITLALIGQAYPRA